MTSSSGDDAAIEEQVIHYEGNSVILDTSRMVIGVQYPVIWRGKPGVAVKRSTGSVDFGTPRP